MRRGRRRAASARRGWPAGRADRPALRVRHDAGAGHARSGVGSSGATRAGRRPSLVASGDRGASSLPRARCSRPSPRETGSSSTRRSARWPRPGSVVLFREPETGDLAIKRVRARGGERVPFNGGYIVIQADEAWLESDASVDIAAAAGFGPTRRLGAIRAGAGRAARRARLVPLRPDQSDRADRPRRADEGSPLTDRPRRARTGRLRCSRAPWTRLGLGRCDRRSPAPRAYGSMTRPKATKTRTVTPDPTRSSVVWANAASAPAGTVSTGKAYEIPRITPPSRTAPAPATTRSVMTRELTPDWLEGRTRSAAREGDQRHAGGGHRQQDATEDIAHPVPAGNLCRLADDRRDGRAADQGGPPESIRADEQQGQPDGRADRGAAAGEAVAEDPGRPFAQPRPRQACLEDLGCDDRAPHDDRDREAETETPPPDRDQEEEDDGEGEGQEAHQGEALERRLAVRQAPQRRADQGLVLDVLSGRGQHEQCVDGPEGDRRRGPPRRQIGALGRCATDRPGTARLVASSTVALGRGPRQLAIRLPVIRHPPRMRAQHKARYKRPGRAGAPRAPEPRGRASVCSDHGTLRRLRSAPRRTRAMDLDRHALASARAAVAHDRDDRSGAGRWRGGSSIASRRLARRPPDLPRRSGPRPRPAAPILVVGCGTSEHGAQATAEILRDACAARRPPDRHPVRAGHRSPCRRSRRPSTRPSAAVGAS